MNDITLKILELIVMVATILITRYVIPWIKSNTAINESAILNDLVASAVMFAEQTLDGGKVKKDAVMDLLAGELEKRGIDITKEQMNALVEASVFAMNQGKK